jgi:hypothetical protein
MATGSITLLPGAALLPDGSAGNVAAGLIRRQGTEANPKKHFFTLDFDGAGSVPEHVWWAFPMPADYMSGGSLIIDWGANATTGNVKWQARVGAVSPADTDTPTEHAQAAAASVTTSVDTTEANRLVQSSITLNMDNAVARDLIFLVLFRDPADAADTCTVDASVTTVSFEYVY